ncbi:TIGR01777 family oxidoreductase [Antribacter gilvus]|uniref:TIGR01777 family oxidoreductase n=1 Tax=Antribacter gilvus TaxID=2304675 RepID=UPI000F770E6F|nr:TIGR01777 family oxidoreductase [Antribacter gilvus]
MDVVVAGSHGFIGSALVADLLARGHDVRRLVRPGSAARRRSPAPAAGSPTAGSPAAGSTAASPAAGSTAGSPAAGSTAAGSTRGPGVVARGTVVDLPWDPYAGDLSPAALEGADAVVNLAGAGIGDRRWTPAYRREILRSRVATTGLLARTLASLDEPGVLVQSTGIGAYGNRGDETLTETSSRGDDFLADVVKAWESAAEPAAEAGVRVAHLRSGIVLAPRGGALGRLLPLIRLGLGGPLGSGRQWWPWITLPDELAVFRYAIEHPLAGPVNTVAPDLATNAQVVRAVARALHRPAVLPVPRIALRVAVGQFADDLLRSQRAVPAVLEAAGFRWEHPTLESAARWVAEG